MTEAEKWGSRISRPTIAPRMPRKGRMPYRKVFIFSPKRQMSTEKHRITASFASSDGCTVKLPTPSQRREPLAFTPMSGTSASSASVSPRKGKAQRR